MPESRYVASARLRPLLVYCAVAVAAVVAADVALGLLVPGGGHRLALALTWLVLFPLGGWRVWRSS